MHRQTSAGGARATTRQAPHGLPARDRSASQRRGPAGRRRDRAVPRPVARTIPSRSPCWPLRRLHRPCLRPVRPAKAAVWLPTRKPSRLTAAATSRRMEPTSAPTTRQPLPPEPSVPPSPAAPVSRERARPAPWCAAQSSQQARGPATVPAILSVAIRFRRPRYGRLHLPEPSSYPGCQRGMVMMAGVIPRRLAVPERRQIGHQCPPPGHDRDTLETGALNTPLTPSARSYSRAVKTPRTSKRQPRRNAFTPISQRKTCPSGTGS